MIFVTGEGVIFCKDNNTAAFSSFDHYRPFQQNQLIRTEPFCPFLSSLLQCLKSLAWHLNAIFYKFSNYSKQCKDKEITQRCDLFATRIVCKDVVRLLKNEVSVGWSSLWSTRKVILFCQSFNNWNRVKYKQVVLTTLFTSVFIFITEVNIVCKIREPFKFFMFNFNSSFLIVVSVVRLFLLAFHDFCSQEAIHHFKCC